MKKLTLRLDDDKHNLLVLLSQLKNTSINNYIISLIDEDLLKNNFILRGNKIMKKDLTYNSEASIDSLNKKNNNFINESLSNYNSFNYYKYDSEINNCISTLKKIQDDIFKEYQVNDILSNSKIYEVITANSLGHILIPGHSGSRDARNSHGGEYEYKHFKESSSNHSWTFNDFSNTSIEKLKKAESIIFAHIDDINYPYPGRFDWYYSVPGDIMTNYLTNYTKSIQNSRKMINVSPSQIESRLNIKKIYTISNHGIYDKFLDSICNASSKLENLTGIKNLLTSNKFWELIVALKLNHQVNPEQGGREGAHDAYDIYGEPYEYKVSKSYSWSFQDISENVLNKYYNDKAIILAVVDKQQLKVESIYSASPEYVVPLLEKKLNDKKDRCKSKGTTIRRLQVSLSKSDLKRINAKKLY